MGAFWLCSPGSQSGTSTSSSLSGFGEKGETFFAPGVGWMWKLLRPISGSAFHANLKFLKPPTNKTQRLQQV